MHFLHFYSWYTQGSFINVLDNQDSPASVPNVPKILSTKKALIPVEKRTEPIRRKIINIKFTLGCEEVADIFGVINR